MQISVNQPTAIRNRGKTLKRPAKIFELEDQRLDHLGSGGGSLQIGPIPFERLQVGERLEWPADARTAGAMAACEGYLEKVGNQRGWVRANDCFCERPSAIDELLNKQAVARSLDIPLVDEIRDVAPMATPLHEL